MGTVFAIKRYAIHDGPNIRTTIFFKGCPLSCWWCHNPEGLESAPAMIWNEERCVGCGECVEICPAGSLSAGESGISRDQELCVCCGRCQETCPALAHEATGWQMEVFEVMAEIKKDIPFYDQSGGGVTFSGGEPLSQPAFLLELLQACGELGIHRVVDTSAYADSQILAEIARQTDLFLIDLKHMDSEKHRLYTGVGNELILRNIEMLAGQGAAITVRIPLIEGVNSDEQNMYASAEFLSSLPGVKDIDILPYHDIAVGKYRKLARENRGISFTPLSKERVAECAEIFKKKKLKVQIGG
ncbi:MAG: glycyl-radical enzyme activating protein [Desulfocapsaceae bacterium]|nr:glycyl-radical enzyme activating protein [Desulfocapsaceae bacterium]